MSSWYSRYFPLYLRSNQTISIMEDLNRIKIVLVEKKKTSRWLAAQLGKNISTVSKWCTNTSQPDLQTIGRIAELLDCEKKDLIID